MQTIELTYTGQAPQKPLPTDYVPRISSHYEWVEWRIGYHNAMTNREQIRANAPYLKTRTRESSAWYERAFKAAHHAR